MALYLNNLQPDMYFHSRKNLGIEDLEQTKTKWSNLEGDIMIWNISYYEIFIRASTIYCYVWYYNTKKI